MLGETPVREQIEQQREGVLRYYRLHARIYDLTRWTYLRGRGAAVRALELRPGERVLEIGCGTGLNFARILRRISPSGSLVGIDLSIDMLQRARRRCQRRGWDNVELVEANAESFDLGCTFDKVFGAYSLSMIGDLAACLRQAAQHLGPGGRMVFLDFGGFAGWPGWVRRGFARWMRAHHVHVERDAAAMLESMGLEVERRLLWAGYAMVVVARRIE
ncbi:MAG: methyltransferase domain-containing protein [Planctomycetes bacterium]|nr:methyltransferase domain-containing protein [Planctomycetota bacterium]